MQILVGNGQLCDLKVFCNLNWILILSFYKLQIIWAERIESGTNRMQISIFSTYIIVA
jgi:hypothetical protein